MGSGLSTLVPCFKPASERKNRTGISHPENPADLIFTSSEPLDETLGHSFCYVRSSNRFVSPTASDRFVSPTHSLRFSPSHDPKVRAGPETAFKTISGASVSANTATPRTVLQLGNIYDDATEDTLGYGVKSSIVSGNGFESTSSFSALPLQPVPRGGGGSGQDQMGGGFFMSGPIERGALSGPLEANSGPEGRVHFSAPLGGIYVKKKRKKVISGILRNFSEKKRPWVVPVLNLGRRDNSGEEEAAAVAEGKSDGDVQWALGKAGEDRVHVVVSEEQGWLFVGIYDGFNGPDAPEFLMGNLYRAVFHELHGLFWELDQETEIKTEIENEVEANLPNLIRTDSTAKSEHNLEIETSVEEIKSNGEGEIKENEIDEVPQERAKRVTFQPEGTEIRRRRLWEFLAEPEDGLDLSGSDRFVFSVDDAVSVSNAGSAVSKRWLLLSKLKHGLSKHREGHSGNFLFPWRFRLEEKQQIEEVENRVEERAPKSGRRRKEGPVDHDSVLKALSRALEISEDAYLDMTDKVLDRNPELALMGSCLLVVLMRDEDVYVMNVGDSRAIVARYEPEEEGCGGEGRKRGGSGSSMEAIVEESMAQGEKAVKPATDASANMRLTALQLSTDHSTSIEEVSF